eukprot:5329534-Pleurochrysis_carterae.AAC.2
MHTYITRDQERQPRPRVYALKNSSFHEAVGRRKHESEEPRKERETGWVGLWCVLAQARSHGPPCRENGLQDKNGQAASSRRPRAAPQGAAQARGGACSQMDLCAASSQSSGLRVLHTCKEPEPGRGHRLTDVENPPPYRRLPGCV